MTTTKKNTTAKKAPTSKKPAKKLSQIEAAQQVLAKAGTAQLQVDGRGDDQAEALVEPGGATPEATRYGSIFREIKTKGKAARFVCPLTRRTALAAAIFHQSS
jgi:hypothetical protein